MTFLKYSVLGVLVAIGVTFIGSIAHAVEPDGLSISPLRTELYITPGTVTTGTVTIHNSTAADMTVDMTAEGFGVTNPQYDYSFDPGSKIVDWMRFEPEISVLAPGKDGTVTYKISAPICAEPRGRYIGVFANTTIKDSQGAVSARERVASLLYITVAGDVTKLGKLLTLTTSRLTTGTASWATTLQNTGTTHFRTFYNATVRTLWNSDVSLSSGNSLLLPGTVRLVQGELPQMTYPGIYKVAYDFTMGDSPTIYETRYVIFMPLYVWVLFAIAIIYIVVRIIRRIRRHPEPQVKA